jgi:hypothetical protein
LRNLLIADFIHWVEATEKGKKQEASERGKNQPFSVPSRNRPFSVARLDQLFFG